MHRSGGEGAPLLRSSAAAAPVSASQPQLSTLLPATAAPAGAPGQRLLSRCHAAPLAAPRHASSAPCRFTAPAAAIPAAVDSAAKRPCCCCHHEAVLPLPEREHAAHAPPQQPRLAPADSRTSSGSSLPSPPPPPAATPAAVGRTLPLYASRRASRCFWFTTVSTRAMPLRTTLLWGAGRGGRRRAERVRRAPSAENAGLRHRSSSASPAAVLAPRHPCFAAAWPLPAPQPRHRRHCAHILDSLLGAPPVTLATRRPPSSCFSSLSCGGGARTGAGAGAARRVRHQQHAAAGAGGPKACTRGSLCLLPPCRPPSLSMSTATTAADAPVAEQHCRHRVCERVAASRPAAGGGRRRRGACGPPSRGFGPPASAPGSAAPACPWRAAHGP